MSAGVPRQNFDGRYVKASAGNTGTLAHDAAKQAARLGSEALYCRIVRAGLALAPAQERKPLSFEEQLALVAAGKARVVEKPDLRTANEAHYGVTDWDSPG